MNLLSMFMKIVAISLLLIGTATANEYEEQIKSYADSDVKGWLTEAVVIDAIKAQNTKHASLGQGDIDAMDKTWRAETGQSSQPMIMDVLGRDLSKYLMGKRESSAGIITEIFVMDNKGLNVGQSDVTSDFWQGDEAKWQKTYSMGAGAMHISDVEQDESTQTFQSQLSLTIVDPADNSVIGAITLGLNVELLP